MGVYINEILKEFRSVLGFDILCAEIYSQNKIDVMFEAYEAIKDNIESDIYIDLCSQLGRILANTDNEQLAIDFFARGLNKARKNKDYEGQAIIYSYIGNLFFKQGEYQKALKYYHKERNCYHSLKKLNTELLERNFMLCINLGRSYLHLHMLDMSLIYVKIIEEKRFDDIREKHGIYINYLKCTVYFHTGDLERAREASNLFIKDIKKRKQHCFYFFECKEIFYIMLDLHHKDDAKILLDKMIKVSEYTMEDIYEIISANAKISFCKAFESKEHYLSSLQEYKFLLSSYDTVLKEQKRIQMRNRLRLQSEQQDNKKLKKNIRQIKEDFRPKKVTYSSLYKNNLTIKRSSELISGLNQDNRYYNFNDAINKSDFDGNEDIHEHSDDFVNHLIHFSQEHKLCNGNLNHLVELFRTSMKMKEYMVADQLRNQVEAIAMKINSNSLKLLSCELHIEYCEAVGISELIEVLYENYYYLKNKQLLEINMLRVSNIISKIIIVQIKEEKRRFRVANSNLPVITG